MNSLLCRYKYVYGDDEFMESMFNAMLTRFVRGPSIHILMNYLT